MSATSSPQKQAVLLWRVVPSKVSIFFSLTKRSGATRCHSVAALRMSSHVVRDESAWRGLLKVRQAADPVAAEVFANSKVDANLEPWLASLR